MRHNLKTDSDKIYVFLDGDGIGDRLELLLLDDKIDDAKQFSESISSSMNSIRAEINILNGVQLLFTGGDDIVFCVESKSWNIESIYKFQKQFKENTGCTLSGGVGRSIQSAVLNLRRAKLSGKNKVIFR